MIERQHRMRFPTAEVGLKFDDRIAACVGQPFQSTDQQFLEAMRDEGTLIEVARLFVLVGAFVSMDLAEVSGELRLLEATGSHVGMWRYHFTPRLQSPRWLPFDRCDGEFAGLMSSLFFVSQTR